MPTPVDSRLPAASAGERDASAMDAQSGATLTPSLVARGTLPRRTVDGLEAAARAPAADAPAAPALPSSTPELPLAAEVAASTKETRTFLATDAGLSDYAAFFLIQQGQAKALALAATVRRHAQAAVTSASFQSVKDMWAQVQGERKSSLFQLAGPLLGTTTTLLTASVDRTGVLGNVLSNVVSGAVNVVDKTTRFGGEAQAQQARLAMRVTDGTKAIAQQIADGGRAFYDQAEKNLANAMQAISDHFKRIEGLESNITNQ